MLSCLDQPRTTFVCAIVGVAAAVGGAGLVAQAQTSAERIAKTGKAEQPILIREHAAWDEDCAAVPYPAVRLDEPPRHGALCARIENVTVRYMYAGSVPHCVGHVVRGVRLYYFPRAGFAGSDGLQYSVRYPSADRTVAVTVTVAPGQASTADTKITDIASPLREPRQQPGPVPACSEQVS
jgi:hypothetical protein